MTKFKVAFAVLVAFATGALIGFGVWVTLHPGEALTLFAIVAVATLFWWAVVVVIQHVLD